jgi:hypothetical protein
MSQPIGYITPNKEDLVFKLNNIIYGFNQSSHEWYNIINDYLKSCGFKNNGLFQYLHKDFTRKNIFLTLYVNDAILITNDLIGVLLATKDLKLKIEYNMIDVNVLAYILGIQKS